MKNLVHAVLIAASMISLPTYAAGAKPQRQVLPATADLPEARPLANGEKAGDREPDPTSPDTSGDIPVPEPRPTQARSDTPEGGDVEEAQPAIRRSLGRHNAVLARSLDDADQQCQHRLRALGVVFETKPPLIEDGGCSVPAPLSVSTLGAGVLLEPAGTMNCAMAEASATFAQTVISPTAQTVYGSRLKAVANASAYVCRPRHGSKKLSEHAFGNALDIARLVLADGTSIDVAATEDPKAREFLGTIRKAACGPFKTVLGPGSDADHATHFHLDLAHRRNGSTFCQ